MSQLRWIPQGILKNNELNYLQGCFAFFYEGLGGLYQ